MRKLDHLQKSCTFKPNHSHNCLYPIRKFWCMQLVTGSKLTNSNFYVECKTRNEECHFYKILTNTFSWANRKCGQNINWTHSIIPSQILLFFQKFQNTFKISFFFLRNRISFIFDRLGSLPNKRFLFEFYGISITMDDRDCLSHDLLVR